MKRWGNPNEIAEVSFLCSDKSSYINGETIKIDGVGQIHESSRTNTNKIKLY